ncbi:tRNA pseudouridine 55 synthase [secondary endosymbiont of Heteropsylla cubana]|uniref:tRNA pseudouridine synthase B n=1 Tax=secondary endosymbiont of Heteropsylla cubana TaxID=134287 RepID=J7GWP3_9ENTR|nr:tRNA pseudouridine(55) synthase TruB [secondary endosymbiont of Heteropsylla cubana]AFP85881.1 tRNA pseudouridine 55 synthase [secondary endosymbiont of Heteropsylla cubana]
MVGHSYQGRDINGILLLDKPCGRSSNNLLQKVKQLFLANKAGHTGALDPLATGMLPICFGEATKFSQYLLKADKRYHVTAFFGKRTNTSDSDGQTVSIRPVSINQEDLTVALNHFRGKISQIPSMFSALKHQGHPLYKYARKGITIQREPRLIYVYDLKLRNWKLPEVEIEVHCSKGTYIRTLIDDLGEYLGCGAHVTALRRLAVGQYTTNQMVTLARIEEISEAIKKKSLQTFTLLDSLLLPTDSALSNIPTVNLTSIIAEQIRLGKTVSISKQITYGLVRLTEGDANRFFGIAEIVTLGQLTPRRLMLK